VIAQVCVNRDMSLPTPNLENFSKTIMLIHILLSVCLRLTFFNVRYMGRAILIVLYMLSMCTFCLYLSIIL